MSLLLLDELLSSCDFVLSSTTYGKYDDYFADNYRLYQKIRRGPIKSLYLKTYTFPFARELFIREIRYTLLDLKRYYQNHYLSSAKTDLNDERAIRRIDEYLEKLPKKKIKKNLLTKILSYAVPFVTGLSIDQVNHVFAVVYPYLPIVLLLIGYFSILPACLIFSNKMTGYILEKHWQGICFKKNRIAELKNRIIQEIMDPNNSMPTTYQ